MGEESLHFRITLLRAKGATSGGAEQGTEIWGTSHIYGVDINQKAYDVGRNNSFLDTYKS